MIWSCTLGDQLTRFVSLLWNGWYGKPASCLSVLLGDCDHVTWPSPTTSPISSVKTNNNPKISNTNNTEYVKSFFSALTKSVQYFQVSAPIWWMVKVPRKNLRRADRHFLYWIFFNFLRLEFQQTRWSGKQFLSPAVWSSTCEHYKTWISRCFHLAGSVHLKISSRWCCSAPLQGSRCGRWSLISRLWYWGCSL